MDRIDYLLRDNHYVLLSDHCYVDGIKYVSKL